MFSTIRTQRPGAFDLIALTAVLLFAVMSLWALGQSLSPAPADGAGADALRTWICAAPTR